MRKRVTTLAVVSCFAVAMGAVAVLAARSGDERLVKLPLAGSGDARAQGADGAASLAYPAFVVEYRVAGRLPDLPGEAPAFRLGRGGSPADVARLARALGLSGEVVERDGGWVVASGTRQLRVEQVPGLPWHLGPRCPDETVVREGTVVGGEAVVREGSVADDGKAAPVAPLASVQGCVFADGVVSSAPAVATEPATTVPAPGSEPVEPAPRPADLPTRAEAERVARAVLERLGVDTGALEVHDAVSFWQALARPPAGGLPTLGWEHGISVGPRNEVVGGHGFLAVPERLGDYPLVGVEVGLERLREGMGAGPRPLAAEGRPPPAPTSAPPAAVPPGEPPPPGTDVADCSKPTVICDPPPGAPTGPGGGQAGGVGGGSPTTWVVPSPEPPEPVPPEPAPRPVVRTVTGARLVLVAAGETLQPAFVFELDGGEETFPVPAVTDEWLERQAEEPAADRQRG